MCCSKYPAEAVMMQAGRFEHHDWTKCATTDDECTGSTSKRNTEGVFLGEGRVEKRFFYVMRKRSYLGAPHYFSSN